MHDPIHDLDAAEWIDETIIQQVIHDTDISIMPMLLTSYIEESQIRLQHIEKAIQLTDHAALEFELHTLGSASLALGNRHLSRCAREMERHCQKQQWNEATALYPILVRIAHWSLIASQERLELGFEV
ncbi:histidine kinase [Vibrio mimicus CAIM 1883]|nr:histidine kinase [Vibrio mimicus CAIM 1883]ERM56020.1 histidine kinase [Vibrio mimicus CAIM 1882]